MSEHAVLSPSAAHRWLRCPGSVKLSESYPDTDSVDSRRGTFAHSIAARVLQDPEKEPSDFIGVTNKEFTVDAEMAEHIKVYTDHVRGVQVLAGGRLLVEQKVQAAAYVWGTADAILHAGNWLHVFDFKYGAGVRVDATRNEQLLAYALGAANAMGPTSAFLLEAISLHIVQPRTDNPIREFQLTVDELQQWSGELVEGAERALADDAPLVPGDHCRWCPARADCPALRQQALAVAQEVFPLIDVEPATPVPTEKDAKTAAKRMTAEQLSQALKLAPVLEQWLKTVREVAEHKLTQGEAVPGYKLVDSYGHRKWIDETSAAAQLQLYGVDPWEPPSLRSPAQVEKLLGKRAAQLVDPLTIRPVTGVKLAPESDPRPARQSGGSVFPVLET